MKNADNIDAKRLLGVYSTLFSTSGRNRARVRKKLYWAVWGVADNCLEVQPLNDKMVPVGLPRSITRQELDAQFTPEPGFFITSPSKTAETPGGRLKRMTGASSEAEKTVASEATLQAEVDREMIQLQAEGRMHMRRGDMDKGVSSYQQILSLDGPLTPEHKFVLNDCGIDMRKAGRFSDAVAFYQRALSVEQADENLYHNAARAFYEQGDIDSAVQYLNLSLVINPRLDVSRRFLRFITTNFLNDERPDRAKSL